MLVLGPFGIVSLVLVVAGVWKLGRPDPARAATRSLEVPLPRVAVRGIGAAEVALGLVALLAGGSVAAIGVAVAYASFAVVVVATAVAVVGALDAVPGHVDAWHRLPGFGVAYALLLIVGVVGTLAL